MPNPIADPLVENVLPQDISDLVRLEATPGGVAVVTINRPQRANAFDSETVAALGEAFETLHGADVRVVFLRGEDGVFCSGLDLDWITVADDWTEADNRDDAMAAARMLKALADIPALTVALVEGQAIGLGAGLVAACDIAVAMADAQFAFADVTLGLIPAVAAPYVVAAVGPRQARGLFATGRTFDAAYAERIGLVQEVVADGPALASAQERYAEFAMAAGPEAVRESKALVAAVADHAIDGGLMRDTARRLASRRVSTEGQEGVRAALEGRAPAWTTV